MSAVRFGLFGTGPWAHMVYAPGLARHDGVDFVGVWGRNPAKAADLAARHGAVPYTAIEALIADVEAVAVALAPDVQAPIATQAARAGRHLLLDKPVALAAGAAMELASAVAGHDVASVVFFTRWYLPLVREFLERTAATGGWVEARVDYLDTVDTPGNPFGASPWRREKGGLWDLGPHSLALVLPVLGPVAEVAAMTGVRDVSHVLLRHGSGAISTLTLSQHVPPAAARQEAIFAGEAGVAVVPVEPVDASGSFANAVDELIAAASGTVRPVMDVRFGAQVTAILAAAEEAARTGRAVALGG
jgi:predicted dehydrogenase